MGVAKIVCCNCAKHTIPQISKMRYIGGQIRYQMLCTLIKFWEYLPISITPVPSLALEHKVTSDIAHSLPSSIRQTYQTTCYNYKVNPPIVLSPAHSTTISGVY